MRLWRLLSRRRQRSRELALQIDRVLRERAALPEPNPRALLADTRWVILDVETSGLDPRRDSLISVGTVAVHGKAIALSDCFEVVIRQEKASATENILVHGIGVQAQESGVPAEQALLDLIGFLGKAPLVAFHAGFDSMVLTRAMRDSLGVRLRLEWLDLAYLCPALFPILSPPFFPKMGRRRRLDNRGLDDWGLDDWLGEFGIPDFARHNAVSDALSTAQLFLVALGKAEALGIERCDELRKLEQTHRRISERPDALSQVWS